MKIANIDIEDLHILNDLRNFNEIFKKDMTLHFWCQIDSLPFTAEAGNCKILTMNKKMINRLDRNGSFMFFI